MQKKYLKPIKLTLSLVITGCLLLTACQSGNTKTENAPMADTTSMQQDSAHVFDHLLVDNKKDPTCGMPTTAGISDTAHYKDHVLGFCSKECKDEFLKNPDAAIAAAELKK
ncbi:MAG: YHS domain-containing protein [Chitinophagaceae bacterium]|nr:YHS domain-containing protein [Chitinophagaceae bacterium]